IGLGHLFRMVAVARELAREHEVVLATDSATNATIPAGVRVLPLDGFSRDLQSGEVRATRAGQNVASTFASRRVALSACVESFRPDALIVEFYPFERWEFEDEISELIDRVRRREPSARVYSSLRDVAVSAWYAKRQAANPSFVEEFETRATDRLNAL